MISNGKCILIASLNSYKIDEHISEKNEIMIHSFIKKKKKRRKGGRKGNNEEEEKEQIQ